MEIDFKVSACTYKLDPLKHTWSPVDEGMSSITVFHDKSQSDYAGPIDFRLVVTSKTNAVGCFIERC